MGDVTLERYDAGESAVYTGTLRDANGDPITKANIVSLTIDLVNAQTGATVNGRANQSLLDANDGSVDDTSGGFLWKIQPADTEHQEAGYDYEEHVADFKCVFNPNQQVLKWTHRMHCSKLRSLTSWSDVLLVKPELDESERLWVELLIGAVTKLGEEEARRVFRKYTEANPAVEVHSPRPGQKSIKLRHWPVDKIVSVKESVTSDFENATPMDPSGYAMVTDEVLRCRYTWGFIGGPASLEVKVAGGLARDVGSVPPHVRVAATRQVAHWLDSSPNPTLQGQSVGGASASYAAPGVLLPDVAAVFRKLRSRIPL